MWCQKNLCMHLLWLHHHLTSTCQNQHLASLDKSTTQHDTIFNSYQKRECHELWFLIFLSFIHKCILHTLCTDYSHRLGYPNYQLTTN
ncbi:hypothetical protein GGI35DRAFT_412478 [Trichoderma velutinum]